MRIEVSEQVAAFLRTLAPLPRKQIRKGLKDLTREKGDIVELEHPLEGFLRLRVGRYRVIFRYVIVDNEKIIRCEFVERRKLVYELFNEIADCL